MEALDLDAVELGRTEGAPNPRGLRSLAQIPCSLVLIREALDQSECSRCLVRMSTNAMSTDPSGPNSSSPRARELYTSLAAIPATSLLSVAPLEQQLNRLITQNKSRVVIILDGLLRMMKYMRNFLPALAAICSLMPSAALATGVVARRRHGSSHHEEARHRSDGGSPATFAVHNEFRS